MLQRLNPGFAVLAGWCVLAGAVACNAAQAATQDITIDAVDANGTAVSDAVCDIANRHGAWRVVTPAVAQITAGGEWLKVKCAKGLDLAGTSTSIDTTQLAPRRASAMPGALRDLGGTPAVTVLVVMRDAAGAAPKTRGGAQSQIVQALPYLSGAGREAYFDFLRYPLPRAFAISRNGGWGFGVRGSDPRKMALDNCERRGGPCAIYAFNQQVVLGFTNTQ